MSYLRTPRHAALDGLLALAILAPLAWGCSEDASTRTVPGPVKTVTVVKTAPTAPPQDPHVPTGSWFTTLGGVRWHVPAWPDLAVGTVLRASAELEIDAAAPPSGWSVVVMDPGAYSLAASPTGLAAGSTDFVSKTIHAAWAWPRAAGRPLFPALAHEIEHARVYEATGDAALAACAGHPGCTLAPTSGP